MVQQPWTTVTEVMNRWLGQNRPILPDDEQVLETLIGDVEDEILRRVPSVPARLESGELPLRRVQRVTAAAIQRAWAVAGEYRTFASEGVGPFQASSSWDSKMARALALTEDEISILSPSTTRKAGMVNMTGGRENAFRTTKKMHRVVGPSGIVFYSNAASYFPHDGIYGLSGGCE